MPLSTSIIIFQPIAALALLVIAALGGLLPYCVQRMAKAGTASTMMNCVSGGLLAGVALLHIIPEAGETLNALCGGFPTSAVLMFLGILLMVVVVQAGHGHSHGDDHEHVADHIHDNETHEIQDCASQGQNSEPGSQTALNGDEAALLPPIDAPAPTSLKILMLSLLIHDIAEGVVLGLQTDLRRALCLGLAIGLHKWCDVSCQVVAGLRAGLSRRINFYFSLPLILATPLAQLLAFVLLLATRVDAENAVFGAVKDCFMSFAGGTFLAIVLVEILGAELRGAPRRVALKSLFVVAGFFVVSLSSVLEAVSGVE
ncbi:ZIP Zinc transporter family protein [Spironucleus salmonicida]|uniref:ZIP Zinc transporter family protein n=1 Tax=Spironucleus salmonicida TaxID=348837 RepID=V6LKJ8_9EUKA|nr:ZIP Zinc transporter family protein [Spironucleus salmonicida]|eukprot:EST44878.1 ZIP Zinc transporter family protein [Spironucleus salmonicida]